MGEEQKVKTEEKEKISPKTKNPVKRLTKIMAALICTFFIWYVFSDRITPYTDQAKVRGLAIPIYPRVAGYITQINVSLHSQVKQGDTIFQLDQRPFVLAVKSAEAKLDQTAQEVGAQTATVKSAAARLGKAKAQLDRAQRNYNRVQSVLDKNPGALSLADKDRAETSLASAVESVASAEADLEKAQQQLGISGDENAQLRAAVVALEKAELDLKFSTVLAPADGVIESFNVDIGYFAQAGQSIAMFVSAKDHWIEASMKENNISNIEVGNEVEFTLDIHPGKVYSGHVKSIGFGVNEGDIDRSSLPSPTANKGWLREPQRFPVIVSYEHKTITGNRLGGQVDVVVYTSDNFLLNAIAKARIRMSSAFSYLR